jgi:uncharacterized protein (TIGR02598 family)
MNLDSHAQSRAARDSRPYLLRNLAFSLVEVTLALGLVSFALIASMGLISIGLNSAKESVDDTVTSLIFQVVSIRVRGEKLQNTNLGPYYFDQDGLPLESATDKAAYFQATVKVQPVAANAPLAKANCLSAVYQIQWPVVNGKVVPAADRTATLSTLVTTATPPAWKESQSAFDPKIDL